MLQKFYQYITDNKLFTPENKILIAVSGGSDSVCLAHLFHRAGFHFGIAHCNFQLRGKHADDDEAFVQKLADRFEVKFHAIRFDTKEYAEKQNISIQMAARELRYGWFYQLLNAEGYDFLATAHHQNDLAETVLLNLTRGTGIAGLHGIKAARGQLIRPLLFAQKEEIEEYLKSEHQDWREDMSNQENKYYRNLIRNQVIPLLKKINPGFEETMAQTVEKISASETLFEEEINRFKGIALKKEKDITYLDFKLLKKSSEPAIRLFEILKEFGFNYIQSKEIIRSTATGKLFESQMYVLVKDREQLVISPKTGEVPEVIINKELKNYSNPFYQFEFSTVDASGFSIPKSKNIGCLDYSKLKFPLKIRQWEAGDYFYPLGMTQKKKVSDFLIDRKIPLNLKKRIFVLTSGEDIVWVIGERVDNRYKVLDSTEKIYMIKKNEYSGN